MRIALLEDDIDQAKLIGQWLGDAGHSCRHFASGRDFLRGVLHDSYDLLILDWLLPRMSGIEVLQSIRQSAKQETPVIFITAKDRESDIVEALEAGADDYMTKPLRNRELVARVTALARRAWGRSDEADTLDMPPYSLDASGKQMLLNGNPVELTHREFDLAVFMFRNAGRVVSRSHILEAIWGMHGADLNTRTVDTHISRLRKKLAINNDNGWHLSAIYQHGYRLERVSKKPLEGPGSEPGTGRGGEQKADPK